MVNRDKTVVSYVQGVKYHGYSFYVMKDKCQLTVHPKAKSKMKAKLKRRYSGGIRAEWRDCSEVAPSFRHHGREPADFVAGYVYESVGESL